MEWIRFFRFLIYRSLIPYFKRGVEYIKFLTGEPLFWVILIGLIIIIIFAYALERKKKRSPLDPHKKNENLCQACKGYGELTTQVNGQKQSTLCTHCGGTGWSVEG
jgi:hypothetical protein